MKKIIIWTIFFNVASSFLALDAAGIMLDQRQLLQALPRIAECAAIAKANKGFLANRGNSGLEQKQQARVHIFCALADLCRLVDCVYSGVTSYNIKDKYQAKNGEFVYENIYKYDAFWSVFNLLSTGYHLKKYSDYSSVDKSAKIEDILKELDEDGDESDFGEESDDVVQQQEAPDHEQISEQIESKQTEDSTANVKEVFCVYVLPAIETACASLSASPLYKYSVDDRSLHYKLKVVQSVARIASEALMCEKNSKKMWTLVAISALLAANLCWDAKDYLGAKIFPEAPKDYEKDYGWTKLNPTCVDKVKHVKIDGEVCVFCQNDFCDMENVKLVAINTSCSCGNVVCCECLDCYMQSCKPKIHTKAEKEEFDRLSVKIANNEVISSTEYDFHANFDADAKGKTPVCSMCRADLRQIYYGTLAEVKKLCGCPK